MPPDAVDQADALAMSQEVICEDARQERLLRMIFNKSGVQTRRTVIPWRSGYQWKRDAIGAAAVAGPMRPGDRGGIVASIQGPGTADRMAMYRQHAPGLAITAARAALNDAAKGPNHSRRIDSTAIGKNAIDSSELGAAAVTHLVTVSCTGFDAPGVDIRLIKELGLPSTVQRVNVGFMGCHGAINGIRTVRGLVASDPEAVVLMVCVELCSLHYRMTWDDEGMIGNALFADGAAAILATAADTAPPADMNTADMNTADINTADTNTAGGTITIIDTAACLVEGSESEMSWSVGDHGFAMSLTGKVPQCIEAAIRPWLTKWLGSHGYAMDSVAGWVIHPGGPRILDACQEALDLPENATALSREILRTHGNMSSPTVLFVLDALRSRLADHGVSGSKITNGPVVMLAFGPGLVAEAALLRVVFG